MCFVFCVRDSKVASCGQRLATRFLVQHVFVRDSIGRPFRVATLSVWVLHFVARKDHPGAFRLGP